MVHLNEVLLVGQGVDHAEWALLLRELRDPQATILPPRRTEVVGPVRARLVWGNMEDITKRGVRELHQRIVRGALPQLCGEGYVREGQ